MSNVSHGDRLHSALILFGTGVIGVLAGAQLDVFSSQPAMGGALAVAAGAVCAALALRRRTAHVDVASEAPVEVAAQEAMLREAEEQLQALQVKLSAAEARHREELRLSDGDARELVQQAQAALEARAQFLANISHELRTPMNAVLGMSELLQQGDLTAEQRRMIDAVHGAGQDLLTLINDVLDFSNLEARPPSLDERPFDLRHVVESVIALFAGPAKTKGLLLGYLISEEVPDGFTGDAGRLRQLLGNLLSNAVKFTTRGSVVLRIGGQPCDDGRFSLIFTVQDTGVGVEEGLLEQLFRPFEQRDAAMNRSYGGAGLGLAISRSLAEAMGGKISADSQPGEGSTFRLQIALPTASVMTEAGLRGAGSRSLLCANLKPLLSEILSDQGRALGAKVAHATDSSPDAMRAQIQGGGFDAIAVGAAPGEQGGAMIIIELLRELGEAAPSLILIGDDIDAALLSYAEQPLVLTTPLQITVLQEGLAEMWGAQTPTERTRSYQPTRAYVPEGTSGRIMLAEDNPVNQSVARRMLERMGCTVELVCDGEAALTAWRTRRYDAILMDCQMPGLDGYQATGKIREEEALRGLRRIPIIAMTANAMRGDRGRCLESGMDDYLAKPFSHAKLQEILSKWIAPESGELTSPFDPELLDPMAIGEALALGGEEILVELFETWLESSARLMAQMERALEVGNNQSFKIAVHTLKSSSGSIGARDLTELLQDMDRLACIDAVQAAGALLPEALGRWEEIRDVAAAYVARYGGSSETHSTEQLSQSGAPILVIDDDPTIRLLIRNALSGLECHLVEAGSGEEAVALFGEVRPRLVLLDVMMDGMDGFEVCRQLRQHQHGENLPILMMTGLDDLSSISQAYEAGATDFVVKPFNTQILYNRVLYLLRAHKALEALRASQDEIYTLAYYDTVTGLPNRLRFTERLEEELDQARREALNLTVMFVDLDRFKRINDTLGHPVGDQLLRCVADRLQAVLHHTEHESIIARFGGDEFVLLHTGFTGEEAPNLLARQLIDALQRPFVIEGNELVVTASLGMTHYPAHGRRPAPRRRRRDVPDQRAGRQRLPELHRDRRPQRTPAARAGGGAAPRAGAGRIRGLLPAQARQPQLEDHRRRGPHPLAPPHSRAHQPRPLHPPRRRDGHDHPHRRLGALARL
ncbi:MAG: diguanylate cyclase (GGDEF)-like protein, partial [Myxococcota bacterium]